MAIEGAPDANAERDDHARATAALDAAGDTYLIFRPTPSAASRLSSRGVGAHLLVTAVDGGQNKRSVRRAVLLRH